MKSTLERELKDLKVLERNRTTSGLAAAALLRRVKAFALQGLTTGAWATARGPCGACGRAGVAKWKTDAWQARQPRIS